MLFALLLKHVIRTGSLRLMTVDGRVYAFGDGESPRVTLKMHDKKLEWSLAFDPALRVGEAYRDGTLTTEAGSLRDFLELAALNARNLRAHPLVRLGNWMRRRTARMGQFNPLRRARRNAAHHYDLSPRLYDLFLDSDRQYSCAYFRAPDMGLEQAQLEKKRHIAAKLLLGQKGLRVLDIGSGWGGLALYLARHAGCDVTGITLSVEQYRASRERARAAGLYRHCRFELRDYRQENGHYDRIVSVGMFEHVGKKNYDEFFARLRDLLDENGVALLHTIGHLDGPASVNPFIQKYIFPGADLPCLSEMTQAIERSGLLVADVEILRLHYAETLRHWERRFQTKRGDIARIYDEKFCRMWEFYLIGCEMAFRHQNLAVFQIQLCKRLDALPVTRDYMVAREPDSSECAPALPFAAALF